MSDFMKVLLSLSLSGTLLLLILLLLKQLYKNKFSKRWQYYIWLAAALRFLLPYAPVHTPVNTLFHAAETAVTASRTPTVPQEPKSTASKNEKRTDQSWQDTEAARSVEVHTDTPALQTVSDGAPFWNPQSISFCSFLVWLLPAVWMLLHKSFAYRRFVRYIRTEGTAVSDIHMLNLLASCEESYGIRKPVELYYLPRPASPVMTGFFHPCLAIPHSQMDDRGLTFIFLHELTHYKRRDLFYKWLIQIVVCVHWFNPFVRLLERETGKACELSCDEAVIRSLSKEAKTAYGNTLLMCSKANPILTSAASSLTMTEGAKQLRERLGAIMNEQKRTKKTTAAAAILTAGICFGSAMLGIYAAPLDSAGKAGQAQESTQTADPAKNSLLPDAILTKYRSLLAFKTDTYQNMTVEGFRENATFELDTPQGMALLFQAAQEDRIRFHRFTDENAFFLCNTLLPLTSGKWKTTTIASAGAERPLQNGQFAELEFNATLKILNPDILISEYEQVYHGLYQTAQDFLSDQPEAALAASAAASAKKIEKKAEKALKQYAKTVSRTGNISLSIDKCMYGPEDAEKTAPASDPVFIELTQDNSPAYVKKVLTLKTSDYQSMKLKDFFEYVTMQYESDRLLWEAKNRLAHTDLSQLKNQLSEEDYNFLTVTLPCTQSESTYPSDRVGNIPPDFGRRFQLPEPKRRTYVSFEWCVQYEPSDPDLTVGQRDQIILNIIHGMDAFVADTSENADVGSGNYLKKLRRRLDQLILENSGYGLDMTVIQCMGASGQSA